MSFSQINTFIYLSCSISHQAVKISELLQKTGIINITLKPSQAQKHTKLKVYNTSALITSLYGCEP
jgi:hypothetical protein